MQEGPIHSPVDINCESISDLFIVQRSPPLLIEIIVESFM